MALLITLSPKEIAFNFGSLSSINKLTAEIVSVALTAALNCKISKTVKSKIIFL